MITLDAFTAPFAMPVDAFDVHRILGPSISSARDDHHQKIFLKLGVCLMGPYKRR